MTGINYSRVALGGLVGGIVANAGDFVINGVIMADHMRQMAQRLNLNWSVVSSPSVAMTWMVVDFIYATLIVWTYAAVRPRLGPGPKTAVTAGLVIFAAVTAILFGFQQMGFFTPDAFAKSTALSAVNAILTSLAGAWMYREPPQAP